MSQRARTLDIDDPEYFALPSLDQSQLKQFLKNPADWAFARLGGEESQPTDAMRFGTAFHAFLMGTGNVVSLDEGETYKSARNRQWRTEQEAAGNIVVSYSDLTLLKRMRSNIEKISGRDGYPDYMGMIQEGTCEQAIEWTDAATGLTLKAKPDLIPAGTDFLVDLKTAAAADEDSFSRSTFDHGYHIQAEFYRQAVALCPDGMFNRGTRVPKSVQFWVFEKTGACDWQPFTISAESPIAEFARTSIRQALTGISLMASLGAEAGYGDKDSADTAAKWILASGYGSVEMPDGSVLAAGYDKRPKELGVPDWALRKAMLTVGA